MTDCTHMGMIDADFLPQLAPDTNVIMVSIKLSCRMCGPLRFIGIDAGLSLSKPATSTDGFIAHMPLVPEFDDPQHERRLAS